MLSNGRAEAVSSGVEVEAVSAIRTNAIGNNLTGDNLTANSFVVSSVVIVSSVVSSVENDIGQIVLEWILEWIIVEEDEVDNVFFDNDSNDFADNIAARNYLSWLFILIIYL